jgi:hypothetical protein
MWVKYNSLLQAVTVEGFRICELSGDWAVNKAAKDEFFCESGNKADRPCASAREKGVHRPSSEMSVLFTTNKTRVAGVFSSTAGL